MVNLEKSCFSHWDMRELEELIHETKWTGKNLSRTANLAGAAGLSSVVTSQSCDLEIIVLFGAREASLPAVPFHQALDEGEVGEGALLATGRFACFAAELVFFAKLEPTERTHAPHNFVLLHRPLLPCHLASSVEYKRNNILWRAMDGKGTKFCDMHMPSDACRERMTHCTSGSFAAMMLHQKHSAAVMLRKYLPKQSIKRSSPQRACNCPFNWPEFRWKVLFVQNRENHKWRKFCCSPKVTKSSNLFFPWGLLPKFRCTHFWRPRCVFFPGKFECKFHQFAHACVSARRKFVKD